MKHIKLFENFDNNLSDWLKYHHIYDYTINSDGSIDVNQDVLIEDQTRSSIINGYFKVFSYKDLDTMEGFPKIVKGEFNIGGTSITSLENSPIEVGGNYCCENNKLKSLKGSPNKINGFFNCKDNDLKSLKFAPEYVYDLFNCSNNPLKSLKYIPKYIGSSIFAYGCSLTSLKYVQDIVNGHFNIGNNKLTSLKYVPSQINNLFIFWQNPGLYKLDYFPSTINFKINCDDRFFFLHLLYLNNKDFESVPHIYNFNIFSDLEAPKPTLNLKRLKKFIYLYDLNDVNDVDVKLLKKYYNII